MKDIRLEIRIKNKRLFDVIEAGGGARAFARDAGVSYGQLLYLLACRIPAQRVVVGGGTTVEYRPTAKKIAAHAGFNVEELFPQSIYPPPTFRGLRPARLAFAIESSRLLPLTSALSLAAPDDARRVEQAELVGVVERALRTLTPRESAVIRMRFGIGGDEEHTLRDVGQKFSVISERIRQIEAKALRKLRHPLVQRATGLGDFKS